MLRHFEKLNTPIKSVATYPTIQAQNDRFKQLRWSHVEVETLWSAWSSEKYLSLEGRRKLNEVEPFDEWEEFAIFGGHYCVVSARNVTVQTQNEKSYADGSSFLETKLPQLRTNVVFKEGVKSCQRRFGAPMTLDDPVGQQFVANTFGLGNTSRLRSLDLYGSSSTELELKPFGPPSRMCHAIVDLGVRGHILIGGRGSPSAPMKDCWIFDKSRKIWEKAEDLPTQLYRHTATRLGQSSLALVIGGKTGPSTVFDGCLLYVPEVGWKECVVAGKHLIPVFGAIMTSINLTSSRPLTTFEGILAGGLLADGTMSEQTLRWEISVSDINKPVIEFTAIAVRGPQNELRSSLLGRFGASTITNRDGQLVVMGGIVEDHVIESYNEVLLVNVVQDQLAVVSAGSLDTYSAPRPLLLGVSATQDTSGQILLTGGGATCFSMGTFWNKGHYILEYGEPGFQKPTQVIDWSFKQTLELTDAPVRRRNDTKGNNAENPTVTSIPRVQLASSSAFLEVLKAGKPVILEKVNLGSCIPAWSSEHLVERIGRDRKVVVHEAATTRMDFNSKNFSYVTKEFGIFMDEVQKGAKMYLRALSEGSPADKPAILSQDFPNLAEELVLPPELSYVEGNTFSSVLRITGPVNMWLHYDVSFRLLY